MEEADGRDDAASYEEGAHAAQQWEGEYYDDEDEALQDQAIDVAFGQL